MQRSNDDVKTSASRLMAPTYAQAPFVASHGRGSVLWDLDGQSYLDFTGGIAVNALGHAHPEVVAALQEQAQKLHHTSNLFTHPGYVEICERLEELALGDSFFLTNSGSEAMESALKLARRHFHREGRPRSRFVATHNSFHGRTFGAVSITGQETYRSGFGPFLDATLVPFNDLEAMRRAVDDTVAAIIVEPIQGNGGIHVASDDYLRGLRQHCDECGALLIIDEIQTGFGRTGAWFGHHHSGIKADIVVVAKALGGGLPLGAMCTQRRLSSAFTLGAYSGEFDHPFGRKPIGCSG